MLKSFSTTLLVFTGAFITLTLVSVVVSDLVLFPFLAIQQTHKHITSEFLLILLILWAGLKVILALKRKDSEPSSFFSRAWQAAKNLGKKCIRVNVYIFIGILGFIFLLVILQWNQKILSRLVIPH